MQTNMKTTREVAELGNCSTQTILTRARAYGFAPTIVYGVQVWTEAQSTRLAEKRRMGRPRAAGGILASGGDQATSSSMKSGVDERSDDGNSDAARAIASDASTNGLTVMPVADDVTPTNTLIAT